MASSDQQVLVRVEGTSSRRPATYIPGVTTPAQTPPAADSRVDLAAATLLLLTTAVRVGQTLAGSFYRDDFRVATEAARLPRARDSLTGGAGGELEPGARLVLWMHTRLTPLDHTSAAVLQAVLYGAVGLALWWVLRRLAGPRPLALLPLGWWLLTPLALPAGLWWVQTVTLLPVALALFLAVSAWLSLLQTGRARHALAGAAAVALGLAFSEKALLVPPVLLGLTLLWRDRWPHVRQGLRWLLAPGAVAVASLVTYLTSGHLVLALPSADQAAQFARTFVLDALLPGLVGGPWSWTFPSPGVLGEAAPPLWAASLSAAAVLAALAVTARWRRPALRSWALLGAYALCSGALVAVGRGAASGPMIAGDLRYLTDIAAVAALAAGLALAPADARVAASTAPPWSAASWRGMLTARRPLPDSFPATARRPVPALAVALVLVVLAGDAVSTWQLQERWQRNPSGAFVDAARAALADAEGPVNLYDTPVPDSVRPGLLPSDYLASALLAPVAGESLTFDDAQAPLQVLTATGTVVPATLRRLGTGRPGPAGECGYPLRPDLGVALIDLDQQVSPGPGLTLRVDVVTDRTTGVTVSAGVPGALRDLGHRTVGQALDAVITLLPAGAISQVRISGLDAGANMCVTSVTVGVAEPSR